MQTLIRNIKKNKRLTLISPASGSIDIYEEIGTYPDRLFCFYSDNFSFSEISEIIDNSLAECEKEGCGASKETMKNYFKIYAMELIPEEGINPVMELNKKLDSLELHNIATVEQYENNIRNLIFKDKKSGLFKIAVDSDYFPVETLGEIASAQLAQINYDKYMKCKKESDFKELTKRLGRKFKETNKGSTLQSTSEEPDTKTPDEIQFFKKLKVNFATDCPATHKFTTAHKYICIVYADGDNMGSFINTLTTNQLTSFSGQLLEFGIKASEAIREFQGLPIYAGGDDLLFVAPVVAMAITEEGKEIPQTIFDLVRTIDNIFAGRVNTFLKDNQMDSTIKIPTMSFGVSITYYKYPLYEALNMSRDLLFGKAKHVDGKNAIAWTLQKNSGSAVSGQFSKTTDENGEPNGVYQKLITLLESINVSMDENFVSAVPHKIKASEVLLGTLMGDSKKAFQPERLAAFFDNTLERKSKNKIEKAYLEAVEELLPVLHQSLLEANSKKKDNDRKMESKIIKETVENMYGILRTAKFIKGLEEDKDE